MSANIPSTMPMSDLLKSTGYNCPEELQGKTFEEATSGGDTKISTNTAATVDVSTYTEPVEIEPAEGYDATKKVTLTLENIPAGFAGAFENIFPAVYLTDGGSIPDPPSRYGIYVAITEDGLFVDLDHLNQAKFLVPIDNGGGSSQIYTTGGAGTKFGEYSCESTGQDFTVTDGKITLDSVEFSIFESSAINLADMLYGQGS